MDWIWHPIQPFTAVHWGFESVQLKFRNPQIWDEFSTFYLYGLDMFGSWFGIFWS